MKIKAFKSSTTSAFVWAAYILTEREKKMVLHKKGGIFYHTLGLGTGNRTWLSSLQKEDKKFSFLIYTESWG